MSRTIIPQLTKGLTGHAWPGAAGGDARARIGLLIPARIKPAMAFGTALCARNVALPERGCGVIWLLKAHLPDMYS